MNLCNSRDLHFRAAIAFDRHNFLNLSLYSSFGSVALSSFNAWNSALNATFISRIFALTRVNASSFNSTFARFSFTIVARGSDFNGKSLMRLRASIISKSSSIFVSDSSIGLVSSNAAISSDRFWRSILRISWDVRSLFSLLISS